jgi:hypothetical protein
MIGVISVIGAHYLGFLITEIGNQIHQFINAPVQVGRHQIPSPFYSVIYGHEAGMIYLQAGIYIVIHVAVVIYIIDFRWSKLPNVFM